MNNKNNGYINCICSRTINTMEKEKAEQSKGYKRAVGGELEADCNTEHNWVVKIGLGEKWDLAVIFR